VYWWSRDLPKNDCNCFTGQLADTLDGAYARIAVLEEIIERSARAWTNLDPGIPWEGDLGSAMEAAVAEIASLRAKIAAMDDMEGE
jgi:hypothetical protein